MQLQRELREQVVKRDDFGEIRLVAGLDAAFDKQRRRAYGAVVVLEYPSLVEVERQSAIAKLRFPYVPGLLSFRELPVLLEALDKLTHEPDLIMLDGHGYAHPRRMGLACHAGLVLNKPSIGCAKSLFIGEDRNPPNEFGACTRLMDKGEVIGAVLRTRVDVKPVYISIGHRVSLKSAIRIALTCCDGTRIPKPTREADHFVARVKRALGSGLHISHNAPRASSTGLRQTR